MRETSIRIGNRYGKLVVVGIAGRYNTAAKYRCQCDCGRVSTVISSNLRTTRSCGCLRGRPSKIGFNKIYAAWYSMRKRIKRKGLPVSERWEEYNNFIADMGEMPVGYGLYRKDMHKGFIEGNVEWREKIKNTSRT